MYIYDFFYYTIRKLFSHNWRPKFIDHWMPRQIQLLKFPKLNDNTITFPCSAVSTSAVEIVVRPYNPDLQLKWKTVADNSDVEVVPS